MNAPASQSRKDIVEKAIGFASPERVPVWFFNRDHLRGDVLAYDMFLEDRGRSEWGYEWRRLDDGTMGQPLAPVVGDWEDPPAFSVPAVNPDQRMKDVPAFRQKAGDRYRLATLGISGFTVYTFLRGFENAMTDFVQDPRRAEALLDRVFAFECDLFRLAGGHGFHGVHLSDDWGTQDGLMISPALWRQIFKPRYAQQAALAHDLGLHVWFHCCGNITEILGDLHEIGMDVINIAQPNVVDIPQVAAAWAGRQCFMVPVSYQTVSIRGTPQDIRDEARRLITHLATPAGGFVGYVEEYSCMGMSEENYQACATAFAPGPVPD